MANKYTEKEFLESVTNVNPLIEIRGKFINLKTQLLCYCKKHDYEWMGYPTSILKGCGCKYCKSEKIHAAHSLTQEEFEQRIDKTIIPLGKYVNQNEKILVKCKKCGHIWEAFPSNLMKGSGCPACSHHYKNNEIFLKELAKITDTIIPLEEYIGACEKILCQCIICKNTFKTTPHKLLTYRGCPFCRKSKGESAINLILSNQKILYERPKTYDDLLGVNGGKLSYDFYLPDYNLLIEYQGEYHDGTARNQTEEQFKVQQEHDRRKREYAKKHNIALLEIWYWDFDNIEQILSEKLNINSNKKSA